MKEPLRLHINEEQHDLFISNGRTLLEVLREDMQLTGTKEVCNMGSCGACTILINGQPILSCLTLAHACKDKKITTIEGLRKGTRLHPLQEAFVEKGAIQCGMCTPGFILTAKALLDNNKNPTEMEIRESISGNLCRCTGYVKVVDAIKSATGISDQTVTKSFQKQMIPGKPLTPEMGE